MKNQTILVKLKYELGAVHKRRRQLRRIDDMGRYDGGRGTKNPISAIQGVKNGKKLSTSFMDGPNE